MSKKAAYKIGRAFDHSHRASLGIARCVVSRLRDYIQLVRLDKPVGIWLLLWPTLNALWIAAQGPPPWRVLLIFISGTLLMRSAGCAINDYADRHFDRHVARTRDRPLTAGRITSYEAVGIAAGITLFAGGLILSFRPLTQILALGAVVLAATYPFTKRYIALPQAYLGVAFGFGIPMAFAQLQGEVPFLAILMMLANIAWTLAYDTQYAMADRNDDQALGIKTSALTFGRHDVLAVMACYSVFLGLYSALGLALQYTLPFWLGLGAAVLCALHHYTLIRARDPARCFAAFRYNVWLGAFIFAGIAAHYILLSGKR